MSFAMSSMGGAMGVPTTQVPLNVATFALYVLPPLFFYLVMAVLAITPQTRYLRVACWPVAALLALRATLSVDMSSSPEEKMYYGLATPMMMMTIRSFYWAVIKEPLVRQIRPANSKPSILMDTLDLAFTFRGYGWDWSRGLHIPRETRPSDRTGFVFHVAQSAAVNGFLYSVLHVVIRSFSPDPRGSIFDETLPFYVQYLRAYTISVVGFFANYSLIQMTYDFCTLPAILVLGQDPVLWRPAFDAPWAATSLADFWGRRWHQWSRHMVLVLGGYPLSFVFGRVGLVLGAFLASGLNHHVMLSSLDPTSSLWRMLFGFGMMTPGLVAEQAFKQLTGRKVKGWVGWAWTMTWLLLWGSVILDGFVRAGVFRSPTWIDRVPFTKGLVDSVVRDFDTWLHGVVG